MFSAMNWKVKLPLSLLCCFISYILLSLLFGVNELIHLPALTWPAVWSLLPILWPVKLPVAAVFSLLLCWVPWSPSLQVRSRVVGDGQHGTARWATEKEKHEAFLHVPFGRERTPGVVVGIEGSHWVVDASDMNVKLLASPGGGKTKTMLVPTLYYNARVNRNTKGRGESLLITDCKGEELQTTGNMLQKHGYHIIFLDFRQPIKSYHYNLMVEVNRYIDLYKADRDEGEKLIHYARAEKYAKMVASSIVCNVAAEGSSEASEYFRETSQGLVTALILLVSEYGLPGERHIISVFQLILEMNGLTEGSTEATQKNKLKEMLDKIGNQRIKNFAGASMAADVRTSMNIFSSALGKLLSFIDAELEQLVCQHSPEINDADFIAKPTAIFLICPDEDKSRHFFASLFIRYFVTALILQSSENGGELARPVLALWDEMGQMPPIKDIDSIFTAFRGRRGRFLIALQSEAQLEKTYGRAEAKIVNDACQIRMFTGISPNATETLKTLSEVLDKQTVQSGSVTRREGRQEGSANYQMTGKSLMSVSDIVTLPKFDWVIQKTGVPPVRTHLPLYWDYLEKYPSYRADRECALTPILTLTSDTVIQRAHSPVAPLERGMFD